MRYDPRFATVSRAEFEELLAIVRLADAPPRPKTDDDRWRADYAEAQRRRRVVGYQQDLFSSRGHCTKVNFTYARVERTANADGASVGKV